VSTEPVETALESLLTAVRSAIYHGTRSRLKVCSRDSCRWAYFDRSRNQSSRWCTTAGCGNIMKMRRAHASATVSREP
jgi:predicted RNA-binding Zn ribbon-like protein